MGVNNRVGDDVKRRAVLEKLSEGINFFSADDILAVAGIDEEQLKRITESIQIETAPAQEGKPKATRKRR